MIEIAYQEAVALRRQEELIREEEAAGQAENELRSRRIAAEKEKRIKKKQVGWLRNFIFLVAISILNFSYGLPMHVTFSCVCHLMTIYLSYLRM